MALTASPPQRIVLERIVRNALEEDIGRGDLTTSSVVSGDAKGEASFSARAPLVLCGLPVIQTVFRLIDERVEVAEVRQDGDALVKGDVAAHVSGPARSILLGERVALNFTQRMSAVATIARRYAEALPAESGCRIADTRKTTPGLRPLERYAVRCGGAHNHRNDLSSAVMIKDNHIAACGGVEEAVRRAHANAPHTTRIECEVDRMDQLAEAIRAGADIIMLDNFDNEAVKEAVAYARENATRPTILEASGGITLERIPTLATLGVDVISVGALTHSAPSVDIGLDWA